MTYSTNRAMKFRLLLGGGLALLAAPVVAQTEDAGAEDRLDEIIVTATLRAANVQDIPVAVTAVRPDELDRQAIADIKSLSSLAPSFTVQSSNTETSGTSIRIRGVGTTGNNGGLDSSVGVFIDGIYVSRPAIALGDLLDIERLEILRGPQGTLFGRNTSAGALSIATRRPSLTEADGFVNASYGNYDFINLQGAFGAPVIEGKAGFRLSGAYRKRDGYLKSSTGAESNNRDRYVVRGQFYTEPSSDLSIRIIADYGKVDENCCDPVMIRETELAAFAGFHGLPNTGVSASGVSALENLQTNSELQINKAKQWGLSGDVRWDLGAARLTYLGSYRDYSNEQVTHSDFNALDAFTNGRRNPGDPKTGDGVEAMTHELRLQGEAMDARLDWLVGAFYGTEDIERFEYFSAGRDYQRAGSAFNFGNLAGVNPLLAFTAPGNGGVPIDITGSFADARLKQEGRTFSVFTHNVFDLTDNLSLTLGARWVSERKDAEFRQASGSNAACQASINGALLGTVPAALRSGLTQLNCLYAMYPVNLLAPAAVGGGLASNYLPLPREFADRFEDDALTYTGQLSYKMSPNTLLYASFSRGFKSGGFNLDPSAASLSNSPAVLAGLQAGTPVAPVFTDPRFSSENVDAYELGFKSTFGRINANLSLFHMNMSDFQVLEFTGTQFFTFNVNSAKSTGAELEVFGRLTDAFSINVAATYADARYPDNCDAGLPANLAAVVSLLCGSQLTNAPKFTGVLGATYAAELGNTGWGLVINANTNYSSKRLTSFVPLERDRTPVPFDLQDAYTKVNARIGITTPNEALTFELWGTNLTNEITRAITANAPLRGGPGRRGRIGFVEEPRFYGVTVRAKF